MAHSKNQAKKNPAAKAEILGCFAVEGESGGAKGVPLSKLFLTDKTAFAGKSATENSDAIARANGFKAAAGQFFFWPAAAGGKDAGAGWGLLGLTPQGGSLWDAASLPVKLPGEDFILCGADRRPLAESDAPLLEKLALGWALGAYSFDRYKSKGKDKPKQPRLVLPRDLARRVSAAAMAHYLARDLINIPAADLGPLQLCGLGAEMAERNEAKARLVKGSELEREFPAIHTVGKAADLKPCLLDISWGNPKHPEIVLIGKGVTFDTGGLDIKPTDGMLDMKKDMGGAATALGLAQWIMKEKLPIRLRVIIPSAENAIAGNAFRPRDIIRTRSGKTVEVTNTDAEGRLVLCDAIAYACEDGRKPAMIIDFATLTGAARVALGAELPALFSNNDKLAQDILKAGAQVEDPLWQLPLWQGYESLLDSKNADMVNAAPGSFAGSITAALFLQRFVGKDVPWAHIDTYAWNKSSKPGRPEGGEPLAMRAVFKMLQNRFG